MKDSVEVEVTEEGLTYLRLLRATPQEEVITAILALSRQPKVIVILLFDLQHIAHVPTYTSAAGALRPCTKVLVAAINSPLTGTSSDLALCCDLVVVGDSATFSSVEVQRCLDPGYVSERYSWTRRESAQLQGAVPADTLVQLGIATRLTNNVRDDAVTLGSYLCMVKQYLPYMRAALINSPRYKL